MISTPVFFQSYFRKVKRVTARPWLIGLLFMFIASGCNQDYPGTEQRGIAPKFRLTDQNGKFVGLYGILRKVVLLTIIGRERMDMCPLTAAQFREAYCQLGWDEARQV